MPKQKRHKNQPSPEPDNSPSALKGVLDPLNQASLMLFGAWEFRSRIIV